MYLSVVFENSNNTDLSPLTVKYQLFDNDFGNKWAKLMKEKLNTEYSIYNGGEFFGNLFDTKQNLDDELENCIDVIKNYIEINQYDYPIELSTNNGVDRKFLNDLHKVFEELEPIELFRKDQFVSETLKNMNLFIHRREDFLEERDYPTAQIELGLAPFWQRPLEDSDYDNFSMEWSWGDLLLTYGMTGVPTLAAFYNEAEPTPQNVYSCGMMLWFKDDFKVSEDDQIKLESWAKNFGLDISDPRSATGYIRLGKMISPSLDKMSFLKELSQYNTITKVSVEGVKFQEKRPFEINRFQAFDKYTDELYKNGVALIKEVDLKGVSEELQKLDPFLKQAIDELSIYNIHSPYHRFMAIASCSDDLYDYRQLDTPGNFRKEILTLVPKTSDFLKKNFDLSYIRTLFLELIEPKSKFFVSQRNDFRIIINTGNDPLFIQYSDNEYKKILPQSVSLLKQGEDYTLFNLSDSKIYFLSLFEPLRDELTSGDEDNLAFLNADCHLEATHKLFLDKLQKGESVSEKLMMSFINSGLNKDLFNGVIEFFVTNSEKMNDPKSYDETYKNTLASLYPFEAKLCPVIALENELHRLYDQNVQFAIIIGSGTFIFDLPGFTKECFKLCIEMNNNEYPVSGHIMDFADGRPPYFHEQFLVINIKEWKKMAGPSLGDLFSDEVIKIPEYTSSKEKFHDHYTPYWLASKNSGKSHDVKAFWGTRFIAKCLERNKYVINVPPELRATKMYSYPLDNNEEAREKIEKLREGRFQLGAQEIYYFNNEKLKFPKIRDFKPNIMLSVAAGFKPLKLLETYFIDQGPDEIFFTDFNQNTLNYMKALVSRKDEKGIVNLIQLFNKLNLIKKFNSRDEIYSSLHQIIKSYYNNDLNYFLRSLSNLSKAKFHQVDIVQDGHKLLDLISPTDKFVFWISNAFNSNLTYMINGRPGARQLLQTFIETLSNHLGADLVLKHPSSDNFLIKRNGEVVAYISEGTLSDHEVTESDWENTNFSLGKIPFEVFQVETPQVVL